MATKVDVVRVMDVFSEQFGVDFSQFYPEQLRFGLFTNPDGSETVTVKVIEERTYALGVHEIVGRK